MAISLFLFIVCGFVHIGLSMSEIYNNNKKQQTNRKHWSVRSWPKNLPTKWRKFIGITLWLRNHAEDFYQTRIQVSSCNFIRMQHVRFIFIFSKEIMTRKYVFFSFLNYCTLAIYLQYTFTYHSNLFVILTIINTKDKPLILNLIDNVLVTFSTS